MVKQKNDVVSAQEKRNKRLKITARLLVVTVVGLWSVFFLAPRSRMDLDTFRGYLEFTSEVSAFEPVCLSVGGMNDGKMELEVYSASLLMEWSEFIINGVREAPEQMDIMMTFAMPTTIIFCVPDGLDRGEYQMEFKLKDSPYHDIAAYQWTLTVD